MKCDKCDEEAVVNYQKVWKKFDIDKDEDYKEDGTFEPLKNFEEPIEEDNLHFCEKHEKEFLGED